MALIKRTLIDPATYRGLVYVLSGIPLGLAWFVSLVTAWSLCLGLVITPLVIPLVIALAFMTRGFAAVEAEIARSLLGVDAEAPKAPPAASGFRARLRAMFGAGFWRAQGYLLIRWFAGFPVGIALFTLVGGSIGLIFAPAWVPFLHGGAHLGFWRPHTFLQSLALVPAGLVVLPASLLLVRPLAAAFRPIASGLLRAEEAPPAGRPEAEGASATPDRPRRTLEIHAAADGVVLFGLVLIWALTSRGYFWPVWVALPLGVALGIHGWFVLIGEHPSLVDRFLGSRALAGTAGVGASVAAYFVAVWAITGHGYFWPVWPMLVIAVVLAALTAAALLSSPHRAQMAERIETLESSRAGAVDLQDSELRRIERDLHDGAQARLVALGMSLGMAEQKLAEDPERVGELIAEARAGAEHVEIRVAHAAGKLQLQVRDDGTGGANPNGTGLSGMRRRVEALDGTLSVTSPPGGPTTIRAELPCG